MLVNNGPLALCYLNPAIRYLVFKYFNAAQSEDAKATFAVYGIPILRQTPMATAFQRNAWKDDTFENLKDRFQEMIAEIEFAEKSGRSAELSMRRPMTEEEAFVSAMTMHSVGRVNSAALIYEHLLHVGSERADIVAMLGLARHHQGRDQEAITLLRRATEIEPTEGCHYFNLGVAYRSLGSRDDAIESFRRALDLEPAMREANENVGDLYMNLGNWHRAAEYFAVAISGGADNDLTLNAFAQCLVKLNKKIEAYTVFRRIIANKEKRDIEIDDAMRSLNPALAKIHDDTHQHLVLPRTGRDSDLRL